MKKIFLYLMVTGLITSCYDEYRNDYPYTTVAFSNATGGAETPKTQYRTVVKGEGLELDAGIYLAGVRDNEQERWADFVIDETVLDDTPYELMPQKYYSLSDDGRFTIPAGEFTGQITVELDSAAFVNDENAIDHHYAIPFRLTETSEDSILSEQNIQILVLKYINYYEGEYEHTGSFTTYAPDGTELNQGEIDNKLSLSTVMLDTVRTNGMIASRGVDFMMKLAAGEEVHMEYYPNPDPVEPSNIALEAEPSTDFVSDWENLDAINSGYDNPANSEDRDGPEGIYGNWNSAGEWRYVQYDFDGNFMIDQSDVYWFSDGGGILFPDDVYIEYWDLDNEEWVEVPNPDGYGTEGDTWNTTYFDPVVTDKIRMNFWNEEQSCGIIEWRVWGVPAAVGLEEVPIEKVTPIGENSFDEEENTFILNYRVDYELEDYYTEVSANLKWRNRIRDGVNEWRR